MAARILDGKALAQQMQAEIAQEAASFLHATGVKPGLATVLVGDNPASAVYVRNKHRACAAAGITSFRHELPVTTTQAEVLDLLARLGADPAVHGILVQLPLPRHIDEAAVTDAVSPLKDVDGFGTVSLGLLAAGRPRFLACTPYGVVKVLERSGIPIAGKHVVIVGRSTIVGKPLALMLGQKGADATVTVCHSRTRDIAAHTRAADIVVMAIGQAEYLKADMVRPGQAVIDVGINRREDTTLVGDVDFPAVRQVVEAITPVPGGVGPMTITMLLHNTLLAARLQTQGGATSLPSPP
jgi:methylenetetrahydrofolate dehydrogenase (NADP+)/methenyltetrahydrofolate cyclohydrolase